jgi:NAD(P)-dependent dehydrogenase (short-subunit alcohol dehydrogenase family)
MGLAAIGANVAITGGRDRARTEGAAREIRAAGARQVDLFVADLSSQSEVRRLADEMLRTYPRIDLLVNNVGGYWNTRHVTADGLERTFALNHLAPFLLTNLLLDKLRQSPPARVVTVASNAHAMGQIDFDDLQGERSYSGSRAYTASELKSGRSKMSVWMGHFSSRCDRFGCWPSDSAALPADDIVRPSGHRAASRRSAIRRDPGTDWTSASACSS